LGEGERQLWLDLCANALKQHIFPRRPKFAFGESIGSRWSGISGNQAGRRGIMAQTGGQMGRACQHFFEGQPKETGRYVRRFSKVA
jgi:hypothetical protein